MDCADHAGCSNLDLPLGKEFGDHRSSPTPELGLPRSRCDNSWTGIYSQWQPVHSHRTNRIVPLACALKISIMETKQTSVLVLFSLHDASQCNSPHQRMAAIWTSTSSVTPRCGPFQQSLPVAAQPQKNSILVCTEEIGTSRTAQDPQRISFPDDCEYELQRDCRHGQYEDHGNALTAMSGCFQYTVGPS